MKLYICPFPYRDTDWKIKGITTPSSINRRHQLYHEKGCIRVSFINLYHNLYHNHQSSIFINLYHNLHPFSIINLCVSAHSPNLQNFPVDDFLRKFSHLFPMKSWAFSKRTRCLRDQELSDTGAQHRTAIGAAALMVTQWKGAKSHRTNGENMGKYGENGSQMF